MRSIDLMLTGKSPLLMHSDRHADPLNESTKEHKALTAKRKKTDDDHEKIAKSEWLGALYHAPKIGPYLPGINIRSCLVDGAKLSKLGKAIQRGTLLLEERVPLKYHGPRDIEAMFKDRRFIDSRSVVISRARLIRYRPKFDDWSCQFQLLFDETVIDKQQIMRCFEDAGRLIGIGDFRPNRGGPFGRFDVEKG